MIYETRAVGHWNFILIIFWVSFGYLLGVFWISFWYLLGVFWISFVCLDVFFGFVWAVCWISSGCLFDICWISFGGLSVVFWMSFGLGGGSTMKNGPTLKIWHSPIPDWCCEADISRSIGLPRVAELFCHAHFQFVKVVLKNIWVAEDVFHIFFWLFVMFLFLFFHLQSLSLMWQVFVSHVAVWCLARGSSWPPLWQCRVLCMAGACFWRGSVVSCALQWLLLTNNWQTNKKKKKHILRPPKKIKQHLTNGKQW